MSPPRSATQRPPPPPLVRQLSLQQIPLPSPSTTPAAPASIGPAPARRGLLRRQRSAEDERPVTRLLHSALRVTASALGPGFLADASPPPPPPTPPPAKPNRLRPVRVAWAELRKATPEAAEAVAVVAQRVGLSKPNNNARPPTCLPALARANLDIFLAHSGLAQCITSTLTSDPPPAPPVVTETVRVPPAVIPATPSPREPCRPPLSPLPSRPVLPIASQQTNSTRRVNFRNAALRVINRGLTDSSAPAELRPPAAAADTRAFRVLSAPAHRSPAPLCAPPRPLLRSLSRRGLVQNSSDTSERVVPEVIVPAERNIRSAPPRRRLKAASAARKKGGSRRGEESSGDDDIEEHSVPVYQPSRSCNSAGPTRGGRRGLRVGAEIVTMVSLVSPAASSDESEDERSPRPSSTPSPVATVTSSPAVPKPHTEGDALHSMAALSSVIVCARKITKSVSFQTRGSVPELVRRASTQLALAVASTTSTSVQQQQSAAVQSDATHATSQANVCNKQHDVADTEQPQREDPKVKKKLLRTKSALFKYNSFSRSTSESKPGLPQLSVTTSIMPLSPPADSGGGDDDEAVTVAAAPEVISGLVLPPSAPPSATLATPEDLEDEEEGTPRPHFETPKEKECWQLYRKMCEKGLTVSFDTVLRGMLTPTEYRLRRGALLSTC